MMSPKLSTVKAARDVVSSIQHFIPDKHSTFSTPMEEYLKAKIWMLEYGAEFHNLMEQARNDPRCYSEKDFNDPYSAFSIALFPAMEYLGWTVEQAHMVGTGEYYAYFLRKHPLLQEGEKIARGVSELIQSDFEEFEIQKNGEEKAREELWMERGRRLGRFVKKVQKKTKEILFYPVW